MILEELEELVRLLSNHILNLWELGRDLKHDLLRCCKLTVESHQDLCGIFQRLIGSCKILQDCFSILPGATYTCKTSMMSDDQSWSSSWVRYVRSCQIS